VPTNLYFVVSDTVQRLLHSFPYGEYVAGTCAMFGELCAMRPVIVRSVITLPCTLLLSSHASIQDSTITALFCNKKYFANLSAVSFNSGSLIVFKTASLIIIFSLSVNCLGFQPLFINLSAIC